MVQIRIYGQGGERVGALFQRSTTHQAQRVRDAIRGAADDAAKSIEALGSADIAAADGKFGPRWTTGLHATVSQGGGSIRIEVTHDIPIAPVFMKTTTIFGKPLLWIPLTYTGLKVRARDFGGALFRTTRKSDGLALLGSVDDKQMKYFGKESVTIPQKWHTLQIIRQAASDMAALYRARFRSS
jgi:hypothetical protein